MHQPSILNPDRHPNHVHRSRTQHDIPTGQTHNPEVTFPVTSKTVRPIHRGDEPDTRIGRLIKMCRENRLTIRHIDVIREAGESHWVDGQNVSGPEGCMDCGDEFEADQYYYSDDNSRVGAHWDDLVLDLRDPTDPEVAELEHRSLCSYCSRIWREEIDALGLNRKPIEFILMDRVVAEDTKKSLLARGFQDVSLTPHIRGGYLVRGSLAGEAA